MTMSSLGVAALAAFLGMAGCGGDDAAVDAGPPDATGDCNGIGATGATIMEQRVASAAPTPTGGNIADGAYVVTSMTVYTGVGGATGPTGLILRSESVNSAGDFVYAESDGTTVSVRSGGTYVTAGADITIAFTCPAGDPDAPFTQFDADATEFVLYDSTNAAAVRAWTFTLQ